MAILTPTTTATPTTSSTQVLQEVINTTMLPFPQSQRTLIVDSSGSVVDEYNTVRSIETLSDEERVFCFSCETENVEGVISGRGVCSTKVLTTRSGERAICFNCSITSFILECGDQYGFVPLPNEIINSPYPKLNYNGRDDIDFNTCSRMIFLDAPMGAGKTFVADQFIKRLPRSASVLAVTFRISLARYLATRLNLTCYLEKDIWECTTDAEEKRERIVVCLDSIYKLKKRDYDIILLDEGTFVQYHFVSGTIGNNITTILHQFRAILENVGKIIIMQHRLPESTIDFYCNLVGYDSSNTSLVTKRKFDKPTVLQPLKQWSTPQELISFMIKDYLNSFNLEDGRSSKPFVVFCSRVDFSLTLYQLFLDLVKEVYTEQVAITAASRIKGVWAQVQNTEWNSNFLRDPNVYSIDCDVLIVTNVLQAGHSLDCHFTTSYDILFNNVLSFREELQFISRLRYLDRPDVCQFKHAWIEKSVSNRNIASISKITASLASLMNENGSSANTGLISSIIAAVNSERADTGNCHDFLWTNEYKLSSISKIDITYNPEIHSHTIYTSSWVKDKIKNFLRGKGAQTIRTLMQGINTDSTLDVVGLLDELQYVNVSKLITTHLSSNTSSLQERVKCSQNPKDSFNVVTNILKSSSLLSISSISNSLTPYYSLLYYLDYRLYILNPNDTTKSRYWLIRDGYRTEDQSHQIKVRMVQMINRIIDALSRNQWIQAIQDDSWDVTLTCTQIFEIIKQGGDDKIYSLIFGKNNNFNSDYKNYTSIPVRRGYTTNSLLSKIFRKISLRLDTKNHSTTFGVSFLNLAESLCILEALTSQEHYETILTSISDTLAQRTNETWADNNFYTTYES